MSFIGDDTLLCSCEWDLMSEAPACNSPMGQPLVRAENKKIATTGNWDRACKELKKSETKEGKKDAELIHSVLLCSG